MKSGYKNVEPYVYKLTCVYKEKDKEKFLVYKTVDKVQTMFSGFESIEECRELLSHIDKIVLLGRDRDLIF